jgi:enoyl-CoA hydratase/carnithine racemase
VLAGAIKVSESLLVETASRISCLTLNRPAARNALNSDLVSSLMDALVRAEEDSGVDVVIITGSDPAFCAGLDLKQLSTAGSGLLADVQGLINPFSLIRSLTKPVIGAVNGAAVTGGLELALSCDFLVASERAIFADTHARIGILPGQGMTALLPQAVGIRKAREMSFSGNFMGSEEALRLGMVNRVVAHRNLIAAARELAGDIVSVDQRMVRKMKSIYDEASKVTVAEALLIEAREFKAWKISAAEVGRRRTAVIQRGRRQSKASTG